VYPNLLWALGFGTELMNTQKKT